MHTAPCFRYSLVICLETEKTFRNCPCGQVVKCQTCILFCIFLCPHLPHGSSEVTTYFHITFESWSGYHHDWKFIQDTYSSMAPINRGNMGYMGFITAFIPKLVQEQAYSTQGVALEFYRNWNVSWNQPWNFFGGISSVEKRNLMPCNASMMQDDPAMRRHVQFTGDTDGVVIANDAWPKLRSAEKQQNTNLCQFIYIILYNVYQ